MAGTNTPKIIPVGTRFGKLVVKGVGEFRHFSSGRRASTSNCLCDCGVFRRDILNSSLKAGRTNSCGCGQYSKEVVARRNKSMTKHGESRSRGGCHSRVYSAWANMLARTRGQTHAAHIYKGLEVDARWDPRQGGSFENFKEDMGDRPKGATIERKDGTKGYVRGNCVWASQVAQNRNTTRTYTQEFVEATLDLWEEKKDSMTQKDFCEEVGISRSCFLYWRKQRCPERGLVGSRWHPQAQQRSLALKDQHKLTASTTDSSMMIAVDHEDLATERLSRREVKKLQERLAVAIARSPNEFQSVRGWQESGFERYSLAQIRRNLEILVRNGKVQANRNGRAVYYGSVEGNADGLRPIAPSAQTIMTNDVRREA